MKILSLTSFPTFFVFFFNAPSVHPRLCCMSSFITHHQKLTGIGKAVRAAQHSDRSFMWSVSWLEIEWKALLALRLVGSRTTRKSRVNMWSYSHSIMRHGLCKRLHGRTRSVFDQLSKTSYILKNITDLSKKIWIKLLWYAKKLVKSMPVDSVTYRGDVLATVVVSFMTDGRWSKYRQARCEGSAWKWGLTSWKCKYWKP